MEKKRISCICGLGNPGKEYANTRHNIGKISVLALAEKTHSLFREQNNGLASQIQLGANKVFLYIPGSFMNLSGKGLRKFLDFYKLSIEETLVIHDELELPFGTWQLREGGGNAGHNGLRSIEQECGSKNFFRIRAGIGRPRHGDVSNWVLSKFTKDQEIVLPLLVDSICNSFLGSTSFLDLAGSKIKVFEDQEP